MHKLSVEARFPFCFCLHPSTLLNRARRLLWRLEVQHLALFLSSTLPRKSECGKGAWVAQLVGLGHEEHGSKPFSIRVELLASCLGLPWSTLIQSAKSIGYLVVVATAWLLVRSFWGRLLPGTLVRRLRSADNLVKQRSTLLRGKHGTHWDGSCRRLGLGALWRRVRNDHSGLSTHWGIEGCPGSSTCTARCRYNS